ncbi:MAG: lysophospholipase [Oscillospiraceae bacterium]
MTNMTEFTFLSTDGKTQLHGMRWEPDGGSVRAVLQICHGVAEHIARYDAFARYLNGLGIAVVGHDHLGHGLSLPEGGTPVYFGESNTWNTVVDDIYVLHQRIRLWYPDVPLCIMGHSMGSFLTRTYLIRYPGTVKAAVIMGTGWQPKAVIAGGMAVAKAVGAVVGENGTSDLVTNLAFGAYNKLFAPNRTSCDWLSADEGNVDAYMADPLCGADATVGLFRQMLSGIRFNQKLSNLRQMDPRIPVLFVAGEKDPVGDCGNGVRRTYQEFRRAGVQDCTLKLYPGLRHEILNEKAQQQQIFEDIGQWLTSKL